MCREQVQTLACNVHEFVCVRIVGLMFAIVCVYVCKCLSRGQTRSYGTLSAATCTCTYVQSKEDLQRTSHVGTPHAWRVAKEYSFIYTMCARA